NWAVLTPDSVIKKGSRFTVHTKPNIPKKVHPAADIPLLANSIEVTVLPGPEFGAFTGDMLDSFFGSGHYITTESNRMGYRIDSTIPGFESCQEIISSGIIPGTIQITGSGQPVILMVDAQTTGGYPRLGNIITADLDRVAQLKPGDEIWFLLLQTQER
ncbi:MAG: hypothetical protein KDD04_10710, partial [Sinomicrobium sp.]|nr:hypothetical protein [Sinomicrobium sp.]